MMHRTPVRVAAASAAALALIAAALTARVVRADDHRDRDEETLTPIRHVVVIFQENVSFDHYFATYPNTANTDGSHFTASPDTPLVNGLFAGGLLDHNPNQDGHAAYSDPLDEQAFLVETINRLMQSREWPHLAIVVAYDDSDGWYDHQIGPIVRESNTPDDGLFGPGNCGTPSAGSFNGRCGYGARQPLLVISPWARQVFEGRASRGYDRAI